MFFRLVCDKNSSPKGTKFSIDFNKILDGKKNFIVKRNNKFETVSINDIVFDSAETVDDVAYLDHIAESVSKTGCIFVDRYIRMVYFLEPQHIFSEDFGEETYLRAIFINFLRNCSSDIFLCVVEREVRTDDGDIGEAEDKTKIIIYLPGDNREKRNKVFEYEASGDMYKKDICDVFKSFYAKWQVEKKV